VERRAPEVGVSRQGDACGKRVGYTRFPGERGGGGKVGAVRGTGGGAGLVAGVVDGEAEEALRATLEDVALGREDPLELRAEVGRKEEERRLVNRPRAAVGVRSQARDL